MTHNVDTVRHDDGTMVQPYECELAHNFSALYGGL